MIVGDELDDLSEGVEVGLVVGGWLLAVGGGGGRAGLSEEGIGFEDVDVV